jgi:predicted exporter
LSGFLFASLNAISLGFAAILVGLAVDYALILYQEHRSHPELNARKLRHLLAPSILWAAVTTAGAFIMVARSSLPGLTQLGVLVAIGIVIAAVLMLLLYITLIQRVKVTAYNEQDAHQKNNEPGVLNGNRKFAWSATLLLLLASAIVLSNRSPGIQSGIATLQFENIQASATLQEIRQEITGLRSDKWLIIRGTDERQVGLRMANGERVLSRYKQQGVVTRYAVPKKLWPQSKAQQGNHNAARALGQRLAAVHTAAQVAGFTPDSLNLTTVIFESWQQFVEFDTVVWPKQPASRWLFSQFAANDNGQVVALGQVEVAAGASKEQLQMLVTELVTQDSGQLVGWSLLADSLVETMKHDLTRVVLPMMVVLVVILGLAYREARGIALSFATLGFTLICLVAIMGLLQWSWNLMNMTALPLLLGAGVDYSIHIQLALKRYAGDIAQVRRSVGNAILLCGASTAAAFASLGFASNPGLASLGRVVAIGIVIAALTAVFLLPVWWSTVHGHSRLKAIGA